MKAPIITVSALLAIAFLMLISLVTARSDTPATQAQMATTQTAQVRG